MVNLMLHLKVQLGVHFKEPLEMHKANTKRMHLMLHLMAYLSVDLSV